MTTEAPASFLLCCMLPPLLSSIQNDHYNMSQEARFLEARQARATQRLQQQNDRKARHEDLNQFWTSLRRDMDAWDNRLTALQEQQKAISIQTAFQRTSCIEQLDSLLQDLHALKRNCLSSNDIPELPPADVRLLHQEFTTLATRLDQVREELIPPTKFTFKRYRAAMQQQKLRKNESTTDGAQENAVYNSTPSSLLTSLGGNVIQNYSDATLILDANGKLTIQTGNGEKSVVEQSDTESSSLLLQNLKHCQVTINGNYKALHIQNVSDSIVRVVNAIGGAVHVTACQDLELFASSHQLRMHESSSLKCHVSVGSGPILEDCTGIVFYVSANKSNGDFVYDAKDFNWLRNGLPSPNFCLVQEEKVEFVSKADDEPRVESVHNLGSTASESNDKTSEEHIRRSQLSNTVSIDIESDDEL